MRSTIAAYCLLASLIGIGTSAADECPPGALGVSRTIAIDPNEHARVGSLQYGESLPLKDHEVVLTFDDGPLPPYTTRILETLASECVKATFFMVGRMVRGYPSIARRVYNEGHTVANHSQNHPFTFAKMTVDRAAQEIEDGHASLLSALGDPKAIAPFFRIPGLLRQDSVEQYLAAHGYMTWSVDFLADDWTHIKSREIARRAINRIEARGKGILLLHDIQPATALALPDILKELKARGFKIVHVVPATADRPKTVTEPEQWVARHTPGQQVWPRTLVVGAETPEPLLAAPSPENFGIEHFGEPTIRIALAQTFERRVVHDGAVPLHPATIWPRPAVYAVPPEATVLPAPGAQNFKYSRPFHLGKPDKPKLATKKPSSRSHSTAKGPAKEPATDPASTGSVPPSSPPSDGAPRPPRPVGHQLSVMRPTVGLWPQPR
jgi:peptidoglycan-N-acetylglucosamine deacetylase